MNLEHGTVTLDALDGLAGTEDAPLQFSYLAAGAGPLVLFHHGFPSCAMSFRLQMEALAANYRVVSIDGLGANRSSKPADLSLYRVGSLVDQLDQVALQLGNGQPFHLVGHDWGAALAWSFAQAKPQRLHSVVGISAPPYNQLRHLLATSEDQRARSSYMWSMRDGKHHRWMTANGSYNLWEQAYAPLRALPHVDQVMDDAFRTALAQPGAVDAGINWYRANIPLPEDLHSAPVWPEPTAQVGVPAMLIWGDDDQSFVPDFVDGLDNYVPDLEVLRFADTRHWPMIEHHTEVNTALRTFLARTTGASDSA